MRMTGISWELFDYFSHICPDIFSSPYENLSESLSYFAFICNTDKFRCKEIQLKDYFMIVSHKMKVFHLHKQITASKIYV